MDIALQGTIDESREYYLNRKRSLAGGILGTPRGSLKSKRSGIRTYYYLHTRQGNKVCDDYLGKADENGLEKLRQGFERKKKLMREMAIARKSLRLLGVKNAMIQQDDFIAPLRQVFEEFEKLGLWEAGLELVGSWCFKVYQNYHGVEPYPLRTLDVDIAIPLPYKGPRTDLGERFGSLGFEAGFRPNGAMFYSGFGMIIELLSPDRGRGAKDGRIYIEKLRVAALALRYLDILLENITTIRIHGVGKISMPCMPAFMLHKLLVVPMRSEVDKKAKDCMQIHAIAKRVLADEGLTRELAEILRGVPRSWYSRMLACGRKMKEYLPEDQQAEITSALLARAADG